MDDENPIADEVPMAMSGLDAPTDLALQTQAHRRAWLTLEVALKGPAFWADLASTLAPHTSKSFCQQMAALLDRLELAGLDLEDHPEDRLREIAAWRRGMALSHADTWQDVIDHDPLAVPGPSHPALAQLTQLAAVDGTPILARLAQAFECKRAHPEQPPEASWRWLQFLLALTDEDWQELENWLDFWQPKASGVDAEEAAFERLFHLGMDHFQRGDYAQAAAHFTSALRLDPSNAPLYVQRGDAFRFLCEHERAIADYEAALALNPDDAAVLVHRAQAYHMCGDYELALGDCTAALALRPQDPEALRTRAAAHAARGATEQALQDLNEALSLRPNDTPLYFERAKVFALQGDFRKALVDFNQVLEKSPHHLAALQQRGEALRQLGQYDQAIRDYTEVLRQHPRNAAVLTARALAYELKGDPTRAVVDYSAALVLEPANPRLHLHRGILLFAQSKLNPAHQDLLKASELDAENWAARFHLGRLFLACGHEAQARAHFTEALYLNPRLASGHLYRALVLLRQGQAAEALADANLAAKLDARAAAVPLVRGLAHAQQGEHEAVVAEMTQALGVDDALSLAYYHRAAAHLALRHLASALTDCERYVELEPEQPQGYLLRSLAHHGLEHLQAAAVDYLLALQLDPQSTAPAARSAFEKASFGRVARLIDGVPSPKRKRNPPQLKFKVLVRDPAAPEFPDAESVVMSVAPPLDDDAVLPVSDSFPDAESYGAEPESEPIPTPTPPAWPSAAQSTARPQAKATQIHSSFEETQVASATEPDHPVGQSSGDFEVGDEEALEIDVDDLILAPGQAEHLVPKEPAYHRKVYCHLCRQTEFPTSVLGPGRFTCGFCGETIEPEPKAAPTKRTPPKPKFMADAEESTSVAEWVQNFAKPVPLGAAAAVIVLILALGYSMGWFDGGTPKLPVYAAKGDITFDGKPIPGASIILDHREKAGEFPYPRATVNDDGTFVLGTYGKDDGAPAGEYKARISLYKLPDKANPDSDVPARNVLPPRYENVATSDITIVIKPESNALPTITLKK